MAAIFLNDLILYDRMPGTVNPLLGIPSGGWCSTSTGHTEVTSPAYPVGTKIMAYEDNSRCPGWYTMQYLRFMEGTDFAQDIGDVSDGYRVCAHAETSAAGDTTTGDFTYAPWYVMSNDCTNSDATRGLGIAIPAWSLCHNRYGFFWVGGVCPVSDVTTLTPSADITGSALKTNGDVVRSGHVFTTDDGTNGIALCHYCLTAITELTNSGDYTLWVSPIGWANATDA